MKDYTKVYSIIFWISLLSILVWVVLKILGYINTPPLVEWYPVLGAIFCAGAFFQMVTDMKHRLERLERGFHHLDKRMSIAEIDK